MRLESAQYIFYISFPKLFLGISRTPPQQGCDSFFTTITKG